MNHTPGMSRNGAFSSVFLSERRLASEMSKHCLPARNICILPSVVGFDEAGANQAAFNKGWNAAWDRVWGELLALGLLADAATPGFIQGLPESFVEDAKQAMKEVEQGLMTPYDLERKDLRRN